MKKIIQHLEEDIELKSKLLEIEKIVKSKVPEAVKIDSIKAILDELKEHILKTRIQAVTDDVTGFLNQSFFLKVLKERIVEAKKNKLPLSLIFFDIDFLKKINDQHGHVIGTKAIKIVAKAIKSNIRSFDITSRYGGDEFMVICVSADKNKALKIAQRVQEALLNITAIDRQIKKRFPVTVSFGISFLSDKTNTASKILKEADKDLHRIKRKRKNKIKNDY